eukprot:NODE_11294_length_461_cov_15.591716_g10639_i0.p1 GENE.NODE_11294_length_461_cov_15.591716_g10639_i0~~NODE_11294_length_461_cov_15.591716_g10639_i0.p1  ORF type:complete len:134 (+),score=16.93 NODE_11294_length_461_cov_15.591716_g10639_i0:56-403(+)
MDQGIMSVLTIDLPQYYLPKATISWTFSYFCSIWWTHLFYRWFVFGASSPYFFSLLVTYASYLLSLFLSTVLNSFLILNVGLTHTSAWFATIGLTGFMNYFIVGNAMKSKKKEEK